MGIAALNPSYEGLRGPIFALPNQLGSPPAHARWRPNMNFTRAYRERTG